MEAIQTTKLPDFTIRESDILYLLAHAYTRRQISTALCISYSTVDSHMYSIFKKTGARGQAELIAYAQLNGFGGGKQSTRITEALNPGMLDAQNTDMTGE